MNKKILIFISLLVLIFFTYCGYEIYQINKYKRSVDASLYNKLLVIENNKNEYQKNISFAYGADKNYEPMPIDWNGKMFRVRHGDNPIVQGKTTYSDSNTRFSIIENKDDQNSEWKTFIREGGNFCDELFANDKNLLCIASSGNGVVLNIIDQNGKFTTKKLLSNSSSVDSSFFLVDKSLYFVFTNNRFVWNLPIPDDAPHEFGTQLLMAGEINIDTLNFREHVIGYAETKNYGGFSNTILIPSVQQFQGVTRVDTTGAFEQK